MAVILFAGGVLLAIVILWLFASALEWLLFQRIIRDPVNAKLVSIAATWAGFMLLSLGKDPLILGGYSLGAVILGLTTYFVGRKAGSEQGASSVEDVFK
ncbi:hypothetical protein [Sphingomonas sp. MS122]|uniref:hypothetical protein n=1 Tax=Sphingomonas sp. MS122 TaxID=3412683 RepID=UPI003C2E94E3